jgi:hypothetical protein
MYSQYNNTTIIKKNWSRKEKDNEDEDEEEN